MHILFAHQNFPGQFRHLAARLAGDPQHVVVGLGEKRAIQRLGNSMPGLRPVGYELPRAAHPTTHPYLRGLEENVIRGQSVVRACLALKKQGFAPTLIFAHAGWGEALYLRDIFPVARIVGYFEFYYHAEGKDVGFDREFPTDFDRRFLLRTRNATQLLSWTGVDSGWSPTHWQKSLFPPEYQPRIEVIHEGIDTAVVRPDPEARWTLPDGHVLTRLDEVLTLVNRNLEPYRGFHVFMRALPAIQQARPNVHTLIIGNDETGYGSAPQDGTTWRETLLAEVGDRLDLNRIHFLGGLPYADYLRVLQVSRAHAYLTYPFVLSWSMIEAMSAGAHVIGSRTAPVEEVIQDGVNGSLVGFFDVAGWSTKLTEALADPQKFQPLREAARQTALSRYDQRILLPKMIDFVERHGPKP